MAVMDESSHDLPQETAVLPSNGSGQDGPAGRGRKPIPPKLYRIGEVVEYSGMSRQTIHNYTTMGLLHESRWTAGGHRLYDESVFARLDRIAELRALGRAIDEIRDLLAGKEPQLQVTD